MLSSCIGRIDDDILFIFECLDAQRTGMMILLHYKREEIRLETPTEAIENQSVRSAPLPRERTKHGPNFGRTSKTYDERRSMTAQP